LLSVSVAGEMLVTADGSGSLGEVCALDPCMWLLRWGACQVRWKVAAMSSVGASNVRQPLAWRYRLMPAGCCWPSYPWQCVSSRQPCVALVSPVLGAHGQLHLGLVVVSLASINLTE